MSLKDIIAKNQERNNQHEDITEERLKKNMPEIINMISFWREYPDLFVDFLCSLNPDNTFHFFFYQRVFLRAVMRHRYSYCTFPRAYSKSFLAMLCLMLRCILYPGAKIFIATGGKLVIV